MTVADQLRQRARELRYLSRCLDHLKERMLVLPSGEGRIFVPWDRDLPHFLFSQAEYHSLSHSTLASWGRHQGFTNIVASPDGEGLVFYYPSH
jgi:hypothetical protein